ncbi:MAG TPA: hypothetical protein VF719_06750 [Abditibacteriaceae bacterium]|jgi:hypothetical protein
MAISPEDKMLAVALRRHVAKSPLDISELHIACSKGTVELTGVVKAPKGSPGEFNIRKEFQNLKLQIMSMRGVREVFGERVRIFD